MDVEFDKWVVYGHDTDDGGGDFEYMISRPTAFSREDCGYVKFRRRTAEIVIERMVTTHGLRRVVYEYYFEEGREEELRSLIDSWGETFMKNYHLHHMEWGKYR